MARSTTSSSSNSNNTPKDPTVSDLSKQIDTLKGDIKAVADILADLGAQKKNEAEAALKSTARDVKARGEAHLRDARHQAEDLTNQAVEAVRQQPAQAMGLAVGIGFLIGYLTSRR